MRSRDELLDETVTLLGGRAAEELVFGEAYTGAADDLARVHAVCKQMISEFGMGIDADGPQEAPIALPTEDYSLSDRTRRDVDLGAMAIARDAHRRALGLLGANRRCLDDLAATALERETLTREDLDGIFAAHELQISELPAVDAALMELSNQPPGPESIT